MKLVECVPNFSEGIRQDVVDAIREAASAVDAVLLLDVHIDPTQNRTVLTLAGPPEEMAEAAFRAADCAARLIDMEVHRGAHPRMGACDVIPFVPLYGVDLAACAELARNVGRRIGQELGIPVFLYGEAATRPQRRRLPFIRNRQYENLRGEVGENPDLQPDFGPARLGTAGATAVGARPFLVAYNVNIASDRVEVAAEIARAIRESNGGLPGVQALGMPTHRRGVVQVSMNLFDLEQTPIHVVFERLTQEAARMGVRVLEAELVGLAPSSALVQIARRYLGIREFEPGHMLEARLLSYLVERL